MINRKLYRTFHFSRAQRLDGSRTVSGNVFHRVGPEYEKLHCP